LKKPFELVKVTAGTGRFCSAKKSNIVVGSSPYVLVRRWLGKISKKPDNMLRAGEKLSAVAISRFHPLRTTAFAEDW
jgi:hypothetical protein